MKVRCTQCGAEFEAPDQVSMVVCPYCSLTLRIGASGEAEDAGVDHYYFPTAEQDPFRALMDFLRHEYGVPPDIEAASTLVQRELHYVPIYFFHLHGTMRVKHPSGRSVEVKEVVFCPLIALKKGRLAKLLYDHTFAVRGRRFFEESIKREGVFHEPAFSHKDAEKRLRRALEKALKKEARKYVGLLFSVKERVFNIRYRGLVHYPIWRLTYKYKGRRYEAYLDGADNRVIYTEHPQTALARVSELWLAAFFITLSLLIGSLFALLLRNVLSFFSGLLSGIAAALYPLVRGLSPKATASEVYELESSLRHPFFEALYGRKITAPRPSRMLRWFAANILHLIPIGGFLTALILMILLLT
ncbi:hypothetical protein DRN94_002945 [archaeon]|nr:hypothetical protein [archaeon]